MAGYEEGEGPLPASNPDSERLFRQTGYYHQVGRGALDTSIEPDGTIDIGVLEAAGVEFPPELFRRDRLSSDRWQRGRL